MAVVRIPAENRSIADPVEMHAYLASRGIEYERVPMDRDVASDAGPQAWLDAYGGEIQTLKARGGYVTADVIDVTPDTPNLDAMLARFNREHFHDEDEVRLMLGGRGLFHLNPGDGPVFVVEVEAGDLIRVPRGVHHWFDLCADRRIRAIRLFQDTSGWTPHYTDSGVDQGYQPVCFGPSYAPVRASV